MDYQYLIPDPNQCKLDYDLLRFQEPALSCLESTSHQALAQTYCLCDVPQKYASFGFVPYGSTFQQDINMGLDPTVPLFDPELENCNLDLKSMTKEEIYFELLKGYRYQILTHFDAKKQREVPLYQCGAPGCGKVLQKPWNLLDHVRMHAGVKPYMCQWCGKGFTQKGNLKKHVRQHIKPDVNDRKRYNCRYCEKGYTERYNLKTHMKKSHPEK